MAKKKITVTVDEALAERATEEIKSLSKFVNKCLKSYFHGVDGTVYDLETQIRRKHEQIEEIYKEIGMLEIEKDFQIQHYDPEEAKKENAWHTVRQQIYPRLTDKKWHWMDEEVMDKCIKTLGYDQDILIKIVRFYKLHVDDLDLPVEKKNQWKYIEIEYWDYRRQQEELNKEIKEREKKKMEEKSE